MSGDKPLATKIEWVIQEYDVWDRLWHRLDRMSSEEAARNILKTYKARRAGSQLRLLRTIKQTFVVEE